jgi:hypothetical protein
MSAASSLGCLGRTIVLAALSLPAFGQQLAHETTVVNIEVPVRVFEGNKFVGDLTINDFEVFENGVLQKVEAVYLVKRKAIAKQEGVPGFTPQVAKRHFVLLFELNDYPPEIGQAVDDFVGHVLSPGDALTVRTPLKTYRFQEESFRRLPKDEVASQLKSLLKRDIGRASMRLRSLIREYQDLVRSEIEEEVKDATRREIINQIVNLRSFDRAGLIETAESLKKQEGQKFLFLFMQKETIPLPAFPADFTPNELPTALDELMVHGLRKEKTGAIEAVQKAFSDASISSHFIYLTKGMADDDGQRSYRDNVLESWSETASVFRELARVTGGLVETTANAAAGMNKAAEASENYYLVYYAPKGYQRDGTFKTISVRIKDRNYSVFHRSGYIAD